MRSEHTKITLSAMPREMKEFEYDLYRNIKRIAFAPKRYILLASQEKINS